MVLVLVWLLKWGLEVTFVNVEFIGPATKGDAETLLPRPKMSPGMRYPSPAMNTGHQDLGVKNGRSKDGTRKECGCRGWFAG